MLKDIFISNENKSLLNDLIIKYLKEENEYNTKELEIVKFQSILNNSMLYTLNNSNKDELSKISNLENKIGFLNKKVIHLCISSVEKSINNYNNIKLRQQQQAIRQKQIAQFERPKISNFKKEHSKKLSSQFQQLTESRDTFDTNLNNQLNHKFRNTERIQANPPQPLKVTNTNVESPEKLLEKLENSRKLDINENKKIYKSIHYANVKADTDNQNTNVNKDPVVQSMIDFQDQNNTFKDKDAEFEKRLKILQDRREKNFSHSLQKDTNDTSSLQDHSDQNSLDISHLENIKTRSTLSNDSLSIETQPKIKAIQKPSEYVQQKINTTPNSFLPFMNTKVNAFESRNQPITDKPIESLNNNIIEEKPTITSTQKLILINSCDRAWHGQWIKSENGSDIFIKSNNTNRYNFIIKFSSSDTENTISYIKEPIKSVTNIELADVILSTHDNPSLISISSSDLTYGQIVTNNDNKEEEVEASVSTCKFNRYIYYNIYTYPYLLMNLKEFSGNMLTSNPHGNDNMMGRLVIGKNYVNSSFCKNNDIVQGYILMKPMISASSCSVQFKPTPLSVLDKLTIQLLKPNGDIYASENSWNLDNIGILGIEVEEDQIKLYVDTPFHPSMYLCGDSLSIKCFEYLVIDNEVINIQKNLSKQQQNIKQFLDQTKSIYIKKTEFVPYESLNFIHTQDNPCMCEFHNVIILGMPLLSNIYNNNSDIEFICSNKGKWSAGGCLLNNNIQPSYTFNITYNNNTIDKNNLKF